MSFHFGVMRLVRPSIVAAVFSEATLAAEPWAVRCRSVSCCFSDMHVIACSPPLCNFQMLFSEPWVVDSSLGSDQQLGSLLLPISQYYIVPRNTTQTVIASISPEAPGPGKEDESCRPVSKAGSLEPNFGVYGREQEEPPLGTGGFWELVTSTTTTT